VRQALERRLRQVLKIDQLPRNSGASNRPARLRDSIELLGNFLEGVPREQGHLGCCLSVLQFRNDADRSGPGIRVHRCLGGREEGHFRLCHGGLLLCRFVKSIASVISCALAIAPVLGWVMTFMKSLPFIV